MKKEPFDYREDSGPKGVDFEFSEEEVKDILVKEIRKTEKDLPADEELDIENLSGDVCISICGKGQS